MHNTNGNILLSICIPTYNRANILEKALEAYIGDEAFDKHIEIVISDNCSTDNTREIVEKYVNITDRIRYYRNEKNIDDLNFIKVLSLGRGQYLKLLNDTVIFKPGALKAMVNHLVNKAKIGKPIFFYQNIRFLKPGHELIVYNINDLVLNTSIYITWIGNFGLWRKDIDIFEEKTKLLNSQFIQVELTIRLLEKYKCASIIYGDFYNVAELNNKGGYNIFRTFGVNYLEIYNEYLTSGILKKSIFKKEKFRLFRYFLFGWYKRIVIDQDNSFTFEKNDALPILMRIYRFNPYFYAGMSLLFFRRMVKSILKAIPSNLLANFIK